MSTSTPRSPSPERNATPPDELFFAQTVEFAFHRQRLSFDLGRTVFASAAIDLGSALLLRYLQEVPLTGDERVLDVGCGHGTLGIVLRALAPDRRVTFVDRDALALSYTLRNLDLNGLFDPELVTVVGSLGYDQVSTSDRFDLVVSNIPGKAGHTVIDDLVNGAARVTVEGGLVGFVVVAPLAEQLDDLLASGPFEPVLNKGNKTHQVQIARVVDHAGKPDDEGADTSSFESGVYDRETSTFTASKLSWSATTVRGLPEFETLAPSTTMLRQALQGIKAAPSTIVEPGQGHAAVIAALAGYPPSTIVSRDLLALRATARMLDHNTDAQSRTVEFVHAVTMADETLTASKLTILVAQPKVHGPWYGAEVVRWLDDTRTAKEERARLGLPRGDERHLVLVGRAGLLGRLEADVLSRRPGHVAYKKSRRGFRVLRYVTA